MEKKLEGDLQVRVTPAFKLKDKTNRRAQAINLKKQFGFIPEVIVIEKLEGHNNTIRVGAVITEDEKRREKNLASVIPK